MRNQGTFDLHRPESMARNINHVINPAHNPKVTVLVTPGTIASEVHSCDLAEILLLVALGIPKDGTQHPQPWSLDDEKTTLIGRHGTAIAGYNIGCDTWQRAGRGSR